MKRIAFITLGCKLNYAETSTYERGIVQAGAEAVRPSEVADAYLVNTCTVTEHSDKKSRNIIRKLHRQSPEAAIFVTGCYAELKRAEIEAIEGVTAVFGADEKAGVVSAVVKKLGLSAMAGNSDGADGTLDVTSCASMSCTAEAMREAEPADTQNGMARNSICHTASDAVMFPAYSSGERTRSFLKVQDGCDFRCSYCTVPNARGRSRNIPIAELVKMANEIAAKGIREIVLTGVNTGDFGKTTGESFFDLIRALNEVEGIERYRISSIEPNLLTEGMVDWIASGTKFLPHFHIPLQSGSDAVLRAMGRRYDTATFERKINYIRSRMEGPGRSPVFFGIDVIVGFPGETEEEFEKTYSFLRDRVRPAFIHIFPYSKRAGTVAAARLDQVQDRVKTERVERLEGLCEVLHNEFVERCRGLRERVLFESAERGGKMFGYTGNYIKFERDFDPELIGKIVDVVI